MEIQNKIGEQVFDKLRSKFRQITLGDAEGNSTQDPQDAVFFNFNYVDNQGHDHGNITVSLIDRTMKIYYSKNISSDLSGSELTEWYEFLQDMRKTAMSNLYGFDTHDITKSNLDIADIQSTVDRNSMRESKMYGSTKSSYQECGPAKIIVRHAQKIDPEVRGSRSRKIESVFVETFEGERFKMPFNSLPGTRAMAQHIGQGGRPYDDIGESIGTMVSEIASLRPFISRNRNAIYEDETTMQMVEAAKEYYAEARKTLGKLKGKRGYKAYAESFEVSEQQEILEDDMNEMKDRFTKKRFSDKMEAAMPTVRKAYNLKNMKPNTPSMKPITEFEEWANEITEMPVSESCRDILSDEEMQEILYWLSGKYNSLSDELLEKLTRHYVNNGEMPYDVGKDDPTEWLWDHLAQEYQAEIPEGAKATPAQQQRKNQRRASARSGHKKRMRDTLGKDKKVEEGVEMCSEECCGKPVTECHCGPECPHCDCHEKNNKITEDNDVEDNRAWARLVSRHGPNAMSKEAFFAAKKKERQQANDDHEAWQEKTAAKRQGIHYHESTEVTEVKSGTFNSKMVGRRVKVHGQSSFGDSKHNGEIGTITRASREPTFSQMHPFKVEYGIQLDNGERVSYRRESVSPLKDQTPPQSVNEQDLNEGIFQGIFNFMWNMSGKIPSVKKGRTTAKNKQDHARFIEKMDDATINEWMDELHAKVKGGHHSTSKARDGRLETIRKVIQRVKEADSEKRFVGMMQKLNGELRQFKKFAHISNGRGVAQRRRKAAKVKAGKTSSADNKLAKWVKDGGEELAKPNRRGHGSKTESIAEGTWAIPDTPDKQERLVDLLSSPLPFGPNGDHASSALYDLIGDDGLFDELAGAADEFGPEADARMTVLSHMESTVKQDTGEWGPGSDSPAELIQSFVNLYDPNTGSPGGIFGESIGEDSQLTDKITNILIDKLEDEHPEAFQRHGSEYIYSMVRDVVSKVTNDNTLYNGQILKQKNAAWQDVLRNLDIDNDGLGEARGRAPRDRMKAGDVVLPKATYSDYLEVAGMGFDDHGNEHEDADAMVKELEKNGKQGDHKSAMGALKRMAEQAATSGFHVNEGIDELEQLRKDAGIVK